jgi:hypothetical protein
MEKKLKVRGMLMLMSFFVVLVIIFMPVFKGHNGLDFMDNLYNSISKNSAYFIPQVMEKVKKHKGTIDGLQLTMKDEQQAQESARLLESGGATVTVVDNTVTVSGDIGGILKNSLIDTDFMYANDGGKLVEKYGYNHRRVIYNWNQTLETMQKGLNKLEKFKDAKIVSIVQKKAVEMSYNYYGIVPQSAMDSLFLVVFSLVFYVFYTLWYGFGIMYFFEGLGYKIGH